MELPFIDKLFNRFASKSPNKVAGVDAFYMEGGKLLFHAVVLERQKDEVLLLKKKREIVGIEELAELVGTEVPLHLAVNLRGVLHKSLEMRQGGTTLFQMALPNANPNDFYWQGEALATSRAVSIARRDIIDELLKLLHQHGLWVTGLSLGPFNIQHIYPFLPKKPQVKAHDLALNFDENGKLTGFDKLLEGQLAYPSTTIGDEALDGELLPSYATAFKGIFVGGGGLDIPVIQHNQAEFFHKQLLKRVGWKVLGVLLAVLLLNSFVYFHFKQKMEVAKVDLSRREVELAVLDSLEKSLKTQEAFIKQTQINKASKASFYADRIAASLPDGIQLVELEVFPLKGKKTDYEPGELLPYTPNTILVKGRCDNSLLYNKWLKELANQAWLSSVEHLTYKETGASQKEFELKLVIAEPSQ